LARLSFRQRVDAGKTGRPIPGRALVLDHEGMATGTRADVLVFGDEALVSVHGELDLFSLDVLREALADAPEASRVVIDLHGVEFLDCAALRFIEDAAKQYAADSRSLRVEHASGLVNHLIEILKLDDLRVR